MIGINVTLSNEEIDKIASATADKVLFTNDYYKNKEDWYEREIKNLKHALSKRDSMLVQKDLYIERLREKAKKLKRSTKGIVTEGEFAYQNITKIYPVEHDYGDEYKKYSCPICDALNNNHRVAKGEANCSQCGVNLSWDKIQ